MSHSIPLNLMQWFIIIPSPSNHRQIPIKVSSNPKKLVVNPYEIPLDIPTIYIYISSLNKSPKKKNPKNPQKSRSQLLFLKSHLGIHKVQEPPRRRDQQLHPSAQLLLLPAPRHPAVAHGVAEAQVLAQTKGLGRYCHDNNMIVNMYMIVNM